MIDTNNILQVLKTHFGYDSFRPNQERIITEILGGKDVLAVMPTGGGKSLCFQLPALMMPGMAVVISPLIALMKDQVDALRANGIEAAYYNSVQSPDEQSLVLSGLREQRLKLLYVAPESLPQLIPLLTGVTINLVAVDEAHCISAWGHDFRPAYTRLGNLKEILPETPVVGFTATADQATREDILHQLNIPEASQHIASFDRKNLYLDVRPGNNRIRQILDFLRARQEESGIIYCLSRKGTEKLATKLQQNGYEARAYHAGMSPEKRTSVQEDFIHDRVSIVVATIAFGMGIDKSNVRWVIHYNMPKNIEGYYQEIGRSGRDGLPAHTLLFYSFADVVQLRKFMDDSPTREFQLAKLERMQQFAEALSCRRIALLNYFGEHLSENCGNCDICKNPPQYFDGTVLTQKVCSAVARLKEEEALGMVADVLRGAQNAAVFEKGYNRVKTYGTVKDISWRDLQQYIIQMINQGILEVRFHENGRLALTPLAKAILFEGKKVQLATLVQPVKETARSREKEAPDDALFGKLRKLRSAIAQEENVPAYIVFSDATLKDMEARLPANEDEFDQVSGVGEVKKKKYAGHFLKVIAEHREELLKQLPTQDRTFMLYREGLTVEEIAKKRELKTDTILSHLLKKHEEGEKIEIDQFISSGEIKAVGKAREALENPEALRPYFEYFKGEIPYWKIRFGLYLIEEAEFQKK
ncbi:DNA helicase RecQ [Sinomicrobium weinanense]|uniref:DNA helicase RecQ n=1 Tax=Sinomicrobium weinanense TaxID=2842200 RepID=A0A926Q3A8_9FLAO|nr:DNA helicase RecQ [Sinomicrobium weinanense]MBC9796719.1 DNA helicase RecQ [Sinomicrobium weinanense]MBU3123006.1 DNA helicase RecQ [Sinomicrobium weinanense]